MQIKNIIKFFVLCCLIICNSTYTKSQNYKKDSIYYVILDSSKFLEKRLYQLSFDREGSYTRYSNKKESCKLIFERKHKLSENVYDVFEFDKKNPIKKISTKEIYNIKRIDFEKSDSLLKTKNLFSKPQTFYKNIGIIEVLGKNSVLYYPIKWHRKVSKE